MGTGSPSPSPVLPGGGCCKFGSFCGDCGTDGAGWCHLSASNCAACTGSFDSSASAPSCSGSPSPSPPPTSAPVPPRGCYKFGLNCGDCGTDGTGWCHQSASNCAECTGSFDSSASMRLLEPTSAMVQTLLSCALGFVQLEIHGVQTSQEA